MIYEGTVTEVKTHKVIRNAIPINICDEIRSRFEELPRRAEGDPENIPDSRFWQTWDHCAEALFDFGMETNERYFGYDVKINMGMQVAKYVAGQYLIPHYDDTTYHYGPDATNIRLAPLRFRKLTTIVMLSDPEEYDGDLEFYFSEKPTTFPLAKGDVVAFPTNLLHGVRVDSGERWVVVNWFSGDSWR